MGDFKLQEGKDERYGLSPARDMNLKPFIEHLCTCKHQNEIDSKPENDVRAIIAGLQPRFIFNTSQ